MRDNGSFDAFDASRPREHVGPADSAETDFPAGTICE